MYACDKDRKGANKIWERLDESKKTELATFCRQFQFPGRGQSEQPVITLEGALKLIMWLPMVNFKLTNPWLTSS